MELLIANSSLSWLCLVALFAFGELFFLRYVLVWFSVGCTAGLLVSLCSGPLWLQISLAVTVCFGLLWFSRPWVKEVRCSDAIFEIIPEGAEYKTDTVRFDGNAEIFTENTAEAVTVSPKESDFGLLLQPAEDELPRLREPYAVSLEEIP